MPIFGSLIYAIDFSRLMRAMLLNLQNGMRIQESLEVSKSVVKNYVMLSIIESSINNILIGGSWNHLKILVYHLQWKQRC